MPCDTSVDDVALDFIVAQAASKQRRFDPFDAAFAYL
jgi:hypothetical protein